MSQCSGRNTSGVLRHGQSLYRKTAGTSTEQHTVPTEALPAWDKGDRDRTRMKEKLSLPVRRQSELLIMNRLDMRLGLLSHEARGGDCLSFQLPPRALNRCCSASHWKTEHQVEGYSHLSLRLNVTHPVRFVTSSGSVTSVFFFLCGKERESRLSPVL